MLTVITLYPSEIGCIRPKMAVSVRKEPTIRSALFGRILYFVMVPGDVMKFVVC